MDLFAHHPQTLVADAEGGIRYWPGFIDAAQAQAWFDALAAGCAWQHERRPMYDRVVDVPRLQAWYALHELPPGLPLAAMLARVAEAAPGGYTSVGLNLYRDGRDSVAMHNDTLHHLVPGQPLALLSLGGTRRMNIRAKAGGRALGIELSAGSLLVMSHASQLTHEHGIPKTAHAVPPRMSVVFRARPDARAAPGRHDPYAARPREAVRAVTPPRALAADAAAAGGAPVHRLTAGLPTASHTTSGPSTVNPSKARPSNACGAGA